MNGLLALAFGAGLLSPVNPCGFALLPGYLAYNMGTDHDTHRSTVSRLGRGLRSGTALTLGFAGTLSLAGVALALGARPLLEAAPWLSLGVGVILTVIGLVMLTGRSIPLRLPNTLRRFGTASPTSAPRMITFGAGYAIISLTCTFGVLLAVISQALATGNILNLLTVFVAFAAGAASLLLFISLAAALAGGALTRVTRSLSRVGGRLAGGVLVLTGIYLITYWWPAATQGTSTSNGIAKAMADLGAEVTMWVNSHQIFVITTTLIAVSTSLVLAVTNRHRKREEEATDTKQDCCSVNDDVNSR